ncbi:uncharacterized protein LOC110214051 isoform X2 [Phascolarctos cinereus]
MVTFFFSGYSTPMAKLPRYERGSPGHQGAGPPIWPSTSPEQTPSIPYSRKNMGNLLACPPVMSAGTGPEPRGQWPGLGVIVVCSLWASASLALASTSSEQQRLLSATAARTPAGLPPGDFFSSTPMQSDTDQSQEPWVLAGGVIPLHPEVPTDTEGKRSAPGTPSFSHVVPEGSDDKGASWWAGDWQSQTPFPLLFSGGISLSFKSRLFPQIRPLYANVALNLKTQAMGPQKDHAKKFLAQVSQLDDDDSLLTSLPPSFQAPGIDSLGVTRSAESMVPIGGDKIDLRHHSLSTESAPPASASEVQLRRKSNSRVLPPSKYEVNFALSSSKEALVSMGTHPGPGPSEASRSLSLPKEAKRAFNATSFPSLGVSWSTETESHVPKHLRSFFFSHSENLREQATSPTAIPATSPWPIRSGLHSRGTKKVTSTSKDSSPTNAPAYIWTAAIPPPTRPLESSPCVTGPGQEFLATTKEHEEYSQATELGKSTGSPSDAILQHGLSTGRSRLLSGTAASPGVFEPAATTGMDVAPDSGFLLSLPPRALGGVKSKQDPSPVPTPKGSSLLALGDKEKDSSTFPPEPLGATSEPPQPAPTLASEMPGTPDAQRPSMALFLTSMSLYGPTMQMIPGGAKTLQPGPSLDPPGGSASSQPSLHVFTDASFPSGMAQDSGWTAEPKIFMAGPSLAPFTETPLRAVPQTSQGATAEASRTTLNQVSSQASSVASALQHQGSPVATTKLSYHSENSASAGRSELNPLGTRVAGEGTALWTTQLSPARAPSPRSQAAGGTTKPPPFLSSLQSPAQLKTRATQASITPEPWASSRSVIPGSSEMPEEQLENVSEVGAGSASLNQVGPTDLAAFLLESLTKGPTLAPPTTWANTVPSEQEKSQTSPTKGQEKVPWRPSAVSHPVLGTPAQVIGWLGSSPSPSSLMTEPLKGLTSPMAVHSHPGPTRGGSGSEMILPISPQSTSGREGLNNFPTSGIGSAGTVLMTSTQISQKVPTWKGRNPQKGSGFLVLTIPLQFGLSQISYTPALANKHSTHFRRLKWEVTLTFRRILSHMNGFQEFHILHFFNGSVFVQSEVEVEGDPPPTSSDLIRCIVTMVHQKMDMYFSWKVDLSSLYSSGYRIENLEPEKLPIAFMVPRLGPLSDEDLRRLLENLREQVIWDLGKLYPMVRFSFLDVRESQGKLLVGGEAYVHSQTWADIPYVLQALTGLASQSVDLSSLTVAGSHLDLQFLPISFLVTNPNFEKSLLEPPPLQHRALFGELAIAVKHALSSYSSLLQVTIQDCLNDSFLCLGELLFQAPWPKPKNLLQTLMKAVGSDGHLAGSQFQVDPSSFFIAARIEGAKEWLGYSVGHGLCSRRKPGVFPWIQNYVQHFCDHHLAVPPECLHRFLLDIPVCKV